MARMGLRSSRPGAIEERLISGVRILDLACLACRAVPGGTSGVA